MKRDVCLSKQADRSKSLSLFVSILSALILTSCQVSEDEQGNINNAFKPPRGGGSAPAPRCEYERFKQPVARIDKKLDLLFIVDTSGSLNTERQAVANGIDAFVQALPNEVHFKIAVMLAHGESKYSGALYQKNTEPIVLDSKSLTLTQLRTHLGTKLTSPSSESSTDGGEVGLVSLNRSIVESSKLKMIQSTHGFYRSGAALAIIFIADENDICAVYPNGITPVFDPNFKEIPSKTRLCGSGSNYLSAQKIYNNLKAFKGNDPLLVSGIIYNNLNTVPAGGENEFGYGYSDLITVSNGMSVDLANGHYQQGLKNIGTLATIKLDLIKEFELSRSDIEPDSLQVFVDGKPVPFSFTPPKQVNLTEYAGIQQSDVEIQYCLKNLHPKIAQICKDNSFVRKPIIKTGLSIDPKEGSLATITTGLKTLGYTPTLYTDQNIIDGNLITDGINLLIIARKVVLNPVSTRYLDAIESYIVNGGSVIGEFDGAALFFTDFSGTQSIIKNLSPALKFFEAKVSGGGALIPITTSKTYVTNKLHPIMQGMPSDFLVGLRTAFAVTDADIAWLKPLAQFTSDGSGNRVPKGTYPAVMAGRCGKGRVVLVTMNHLQAISLSPVNTMFGNAIRWATGN